MKPRKIVQVALLNGSDSWSARLYAVADDGSLWISEHWTGGAFSPWTQLPPLPPIEEPEGEDDLLVERREREAEQDEIERECRRMKEQP